MPPTDWHAANPEYSDQRGLARRLKNLIPEQVYRRGVVAFNATMTRMPDALKYGVGTELRRRRLPYSLLRSGDTVVQVGAPRDILRAGRSRAVHFSRLVGKNGRVIVLEPDVESAQALREFALRSRSENIRVHAIGAWSHATTLTFLASATHPASSVVDGVKDLTIEDTDYRDYQRVAIEVDSIDAVLERDGIDSVALISITTNGSELEIVKGMAGTIARSAPYISLAKTGTDYVAAMDRLGYRCVANDDRGFCFGRAGSG
jgi:FkbM family methyltransferase